MTFPNLWRAAGGSRCGKKSVESARISVPRSALTDRHAASVAKARLRRLARRCGIETSYSDMAGRVCHVAPETLKAILNLRGCAATVISPRGTKGNSPGFPSLGKPATSAFSPGGTKEKGNLLEPVYVAWDGVLNSLRRQIALRSAGRKYGVTVFLEDGGQTQLEFRRKGIPKDLQHLPLGYHRIRFEIDGNISESLLVSAPRRSYVSPNTRNQRLGLFAPLYALHSETSWGAGNFSDLNKLANWASGQGISVVATMPLLAGFLESGGDPSPYNPITRLFWNEFYVDIEALPELANSPAARKQIRSYTFQSRLARLRKSKWVEYGEGMNRRREVLRLIASRVDPAAVDGFLRSRPEVLEYAGFRAVHDRLRTPWQRWPERLRNGQIKAEDFSSEDEKFYVFAQIAAQRQMDALVADNRRKNIQLYLDLPVGVNREGFDVWRHKDLFASEASVGAPPDLFFNQGQNWGFPPMIPERMRETGYAHIIEYLRFQMRHAGILRIDHVMGLHRLYWIPPGFSAKEGAYVRYPAEELHAIVCLESHRNRCEIVGENLGIVPGAVNKAMDEHRYRRMYVVQFEQRLKQPALRTPPKDAVASLDTHDTPTFTAHWLGKDIEFRVKLGQLQRGQARAERQRRRKLNAATEKFLIEKRLLKGARVEPEVITRALLRWLGRTASGIVLLSLETLWGERRPQNVPGTLKEYRNWRRKAVLSLEQIRRKLIVHS